MGLIDWLRQLLLSRLLHLFGTYDFSMWSVQFFSTIPERILLFLLCSIVMAGSLLAASRLRSSVARVFLPAVAAFALFAGLNTIFPRSLGALTPLLLASLAANVLFAERLRGHKKGARRVAWLFCVILIPGLGAAMLDGWSLMGLAKRLHADKTVRQFAFGEFTSIAVDARLGVLFANGHSTNHLLVYDLNALDQPPRRSPVKLDWAEQFEYDPLGQEIYVYNQQADTLLILDATTLTLKKSVAGLNLSEGDVAIVTDRHTDSIVIRSEDVWPSREPSPTDDGTKAPIVVVDRASGKLLYRMRWCEGLCNPGRAMIHSRKPILYLGFTDSVLAYHTRARKVIARTEAGFRWMDGMALTPEGDELLVAAPVYSAVLRFDADTLEYKGRIAAAFGVRTLHVDRERKLLLTASLLSSVMEVIDLNTNARMARYWVSPWLRVIDVHTSDGTAFVSSAEGLFRVDYLTRVPGRAKAALEK